MKHVFLIQSQAVNEGTPETLLGCPFIVMPEGMPDEINLFLQEFWLGKWKPFEEEASSGSFRQRRTIHRPMATTCREMANRLLNVSKWCGDPRMQHDASPISPLTLEDDDLDRYGRHMEAGLWSADGAPLSSATIGQRQIAAIALRKWAADRGFAQAPRFATFFTKARVGRRGGGRATVHRKGYVAVRRQDPSTILYPDTSQVTKFLDSIEDSALRLAALLVFFCGIRAAELCRLTVKDVTAPKLLAGPQRFISVLGKGRKRRNVEISESLLSEINDYIESERPIRLLQAKGAKPDQLLISAALGKPLTYRTIWRCFRASRLGLSPHLGRHWYAVNYLLQAWQREEQKAARSGRYLSSDLMPTHLDINIVLLQQNLGHSDLKTTQKYLVAVVQHINKTNVAMSYQNYIDGKRGPA